MVSAVIAGLAARMFRPFLPGRTQRVDVRIKLFDGTSGAFKCRVTIWNWKSAFPEFLNALKTEKEHADDRVERSLYQRAVGYTYDAVKIFNTPNGVVKVPYREHVPPDPVSCFFWLKNRRKETWRDNATPTNNVMDNRVFTITIGQARIGNGIDHSADAKECIEHIPV